MEAGCGGAGAAVSDPHCVTRSVPKDVQQPGLRGAPGLPGWGVPAAPLLTGWAASVCLSNQSPVSNEHTGPLFKSQKKVLFKVLEYETFSLFPGEGR